MENLYEVLKGIVEFLGVIVPLLIAVAYLTLAESKIIASMQQRRGPDVVGVYGLLQPFADGLKLLAKEYVLPSSANPVLFFLAPVITFFLALAAWVVVPFGEGWVFADINVGVLYLFGISSLGVYGIITSGWASNSKYAFLGALRSAAQMVSYEVSMGLILFCSLICAGSLNVSAIVAAQEQTLWYVFPLFPLFIMFFISALAETNRSPFDLPEAEAELVSGYNVEYGAVGFTLFFLGEYANMILMCSLTTLFFLGGWTPPCDWIVFSWIPGVIWFGMKVTFLLFVFVWVRAAFPRYRYDQLMRLGWKIFLPFSFAWVLFVSSLLIALDGLPF
jgi:NADH-quinone oxidoreductase subunit H